MTGKEKKQRIAELRAELRKLQAAPRSDWHTAFEAFLRFKTYKYKGITISTEVEIGADAPRTDYVILTEEETQEFEEAIFRIFRKINLIEYKNPHDSLNERVIHKIIGYAHLMIGTAEHEGDVSPEDVTISIFRAAKNPALFRSMQKSGKLVRTDTPGIYRVAGITEIPFQIVITGELEGDDNAAARALTDKANGHDIEYVIDELRRKKNDDVLEHYRIFLSLVAEKNPDIFEDIRRVNSMDPGNMIVFENELNARLCAREQEATIGHLRDIMNKLKYNAEQAMDLLSIPPEQRETYIRLIEKKT